LNRLTPSTRMSKRLHVMGCITRISKNVPASDIAHNYMDHLKYMNRCTCENK
jgi:hypothetical protein